LPFNFFLLPCSLPAWFAVVTAAAATTIAVTITASTAAAATTTITTTTAVTATVAATSVAATPAIGSRASFINRQIAAIEVFAVELLDRRRRFFRRSHFDKAETARATCHPIFDNLGRFHGPGLRKVIAQIVAGRLKGEISHIKFCSHYLFCPYPLVQKEARNSITETKAG
jgi:hypothetical protein